MDKQRSALARVMADEAEALSGTRIPLLRYIAGARLRVVLTAPLIYALLIPFVFLDAMVSLYQAVCFRAYGIERANRADYIVFDRHKLPYLNALERLNCTYCAYVNGLLAYVREIAIRTEDYWCPIKHHRYVKGRPKTYDEFPEFGDATTYRDRVDRR